MTTEELIESLQICMDLSKSCKGCHFYECDGSCLQKVLSSAADRLQALSVALKMAREENTALIAERDSGVNPDGD